ncbi:hypothetical protein V5799_005948 [Amblyomma americanum]|uniref:Uncharacterized protein n=1 Tax=Amblyomma americanum TaxID=6943 RepID=A0AAQ4DXT3_AMBAM
MLGNADFGRNFNSLGPRSPLPLYDVTENATADLARQGGASSVPPVRKLKVGHRGRAVTQATALTLGAFLDRNYRANLKARLFAQDSSENSASGQAASQRNQSFAYADIWGDGEDDKAAKSFTFEASTKSAIRELLDSVHNDNNRLMDVRESQAWRISAEMTEAAFETRSENAETMAAELTTEIETMPERGLTLEDFKIYRYPGANQFTGVLETAFQEFKRAKLKPVK